MTEALSALTAWALAQPGVTCVVAETDEANTASHKILLRNNFSVYKKERPVWWWRRQKEVGPSIPKG